MIFVELPPIDLYDPRIVFAECGKDQRIWCSPRDDTVTALVSYPDYGHLIKIGVWFISTSGYAVRTRPALKGKKNGLGMIWMHRIVCERAFGPAPSHLHVADHKNSNRLDNRRENLRWATLSDNGRNRNGYIVRNPTLL